VASVSRPDLQGLDDFTASHGIRYHAGKMTKDIVGKLTKFLSKPVAAGDEAAVVYVLADVRRLL